MTQSDYQYNNSRGWLDRGPGGQGAVGVDGYWGDLGFGMQWIQYGEWYANDPNNPQGRQMTLRPSPRGFPRLLPPPTRPSISRDDVRPADPDIIVFDEEIDPDFLVQSFFQEFGGTELINISRHDLINGDDVSYSPIINLSNLRQSFNPNNIIGIASFQQNIEQFGIDLLDRGVVTPYFDGNGDLVIEIEEVRFDESIEVQITSSGTINRIEL